MVVKGGGVELDEVTVQLKAVLLCESSEKGRGTGSFLINAAKQTVPEQSKIQHIQGNGFFLNDGERIG